LRFNIEPLMPRPRERGLQEGLKLDLYRLGPIKVADIPGTLERLSFPSR
jgi:hypothetical protein